MGIKKSIIVLFGKPNVGKSTLFNALQKKDFAITSRKPQTTRVNSYTIIDLDENKQVALIDTPGFHLPNNKLDKFLNQQITKAFNCATNAYFIFDNTRHFDKEDEVVLKNMQNFNIDKKVLIINKIDKNDKLNPNDETKLKQYHFDHTIYLSAINQTNIDKLIQLMKDGCLYEDLDITSFKEPSDEFISQEIIRLSCINILEKELPYAIGINLNKFSYLQDKNLLEIDAEIFVEKESQKPIVIGKHGTMIKKIGIDARKKLLEIFDCKINLKLFVKVQKDWRNNEYIINSLGYKNT